MRHRLRITEDMAEKLTPPKPATSGAAGGVGDDEKQSAARTQLLMTLAKCCFDQGAYHLACKKYTQVTAKFDVMIGSFNSTLFTYRIACLNFIRRVIRSGR